MSAREKFVPLSRASTSRLRFSVTLPEFIDSDQIGINVQEIHRLCRLGGIKHLQVTGLTEGETTQYKPTIVGVSPQGEAYAGKVATKTEVATSKATSELRRGYNNLPPSARWIDGKIELNLSEIKQRIQQDDSLPRGVRTSSAWADHVNNALKEGIAKIGISHLLLGMTKFEAAVALVTDIDATLIAANAEPLIQPIMHNYHPHIPALADVIFGLVFRNGGLNLWERYNHRHNVAKEDFRFSLFYGPEIDRALALGVMVATRRLAKALPQNSSSF